MLFSFFSYYVEWPFDHFFVNVRYIERNESKRHQDDTDEENDKYSEVFGIREGECPIPLEEILSEKYIGTSNKGE